MYMINYTLLEISKERPEPIAKQIANLIMKNVEMQLLLPGEKLPTERELAQLLQVSRGTIKAAYQYLEQSNVIRTRQGSGSFVLRDEELSQKIRREKAVHLLADTVTSLREMGLSISEMTHLFDACVSQLTDAVVNIAIIHDSAELLLDISRQLSYQPRVMTSIFITESITESKEPEELLRNFDIIVIPEPQYQEVYTRLPMLQEKCMEAAISPTSETLIHMTTIGREQRIGIICRTNMFLSTVKRLLLSYGFQENNIVSYFEMDYTTETYFPGGIHALISFGDAHIFKNPNFAFRNEEFEQKNGKIIAFKHQLERGTLLMLEDRIRRINAKKAGEILKS